MESCPSFERLSDLLADRLGGADVSVLEAHVETCRACQQALDRLTNKSDTPSASAPATSLGSGRDFLRRLEQQPPTGAWCSAHGDGKGTPLPDAIAAGTGGPRIPPTIPGHELFGELGHGGMGVVYRARQHGLRRSLAVKVLLDKHRGRAELKSRFLAEAQIMAGLQHPGIAPIHEIGSLADGRPYFSMKQVRGETLAELLKSRGASPEASGQEKAGAADHASRPTDHDPHLLGIFEQVCQTLAYVHAQRVVHRDLKPANIMVGAFGEVQVMDWGLAKRIGAGDSTSAEAATESGYDAPANPDSDSQAPRLTEAGRVLGTPAYMAPEQARGEVRNLDERCDVFGLGAILCEILTGKPPFPGDTQMDSHRRAQKGDLSEALAGLDGCGAEEELVALAKKCLAADRDQRPANAGVVAAEVAGYQARVRERLRQAELGRATAQARADVERKRRRLGLVLAGLIVVFGLAVSSAGAWYVAQQADQDARRERLDEDLEKALDDIAAHQQTLHRQLAETKAATGTVYELISDIDHWRNLIYKSRTAWERAAALAAGGRGLLDESWDRRLAALDDAIREDEEDWQKFKRLDQTRTDASTTIEGQWDDRLAAKEYPKLFRDMGLDVTAGNVADVAEQIRASRIRHALVAALDYWAQVLPAEDKSLPRVLEVARRADPHPWRDQLRDTKAWRAKDQLLGLLQKAPLGQTSPQSVILLVWRCKQWWMREKTESDEVREHMYQEAMTLLRQAVVHHPRDFWLHFTLAEAVIDNGERIGSYRAALVVRPNSTVAHVNLGHRLVVKGYELAAEKHYRMAIAIDAKDSLGHYHLALLLSHKSDIDGAIQHYRKAIEHAPTLAQAHNNLGLALSDKGDKEGALRCYKEALKHDPHLPQAHHNLTHVYLDRNDLPAALNHLRKAADHSKAHVETVYNAGCMIKDHDLDEGIYYFRKAIQMKPNYAEAHNNLAMCLRGKGDKNGAIFHYGKALDSEPKLVQALIGLGNLLFDKKDYDGAIARFQKLVELEPKALSGHMGLGKALVGKGDWPGGIKHLRAAVAIAPKSAPAHNDLGKVLSDFNELDAALIHLQIAIDLDPSNEFAQNNLAVTHYRKALALKTTANPTNALKHLVKTIEFAPKHVAARIDLAMILAEMGDLSAATTHLKKAVELAPKDPAAHQNLGIVLNASKDLVGAVKHIRKAIELDGKDASGYLALGHALQFTGEFAEAKQVTVQAIEMLPPGHPFLNTAQMQLKECQDLLALDEKFAAMQKAHVKPRDAGEQIQFAKFCHRHKNLHATAIEMYMAAFTDQPMLLGKHRFHAACAAALAGTRAGKDAAKLDATAKTKLRQQALTWLKEELEIQARKLQGESTSAKAAKDLNYWRTGGELAGVRESKALEQLPEAERKDWQALWAQIDKVLQVKGPA